MSTLHDLLGSERASKRIIVSVPAALAPHIERAAGRSRSLSEWVTNAVTRTLEEHSIREPKRAEVA